MKYRDHADQYFDMGGSYVVDIEQIDEKRILISLGENDLERLSVKFEELSLDEIRSREVINELLMYASKTTGVSFKNKRIVIEALKYQHGCLLLLTVKEKFDRSKRYRIKNTEEPYIFKFDDAESFLCCIRELYKLSSGQTTTAVLYRKSYYLIVTSSLPLSNKFKHIISEFSSEKHRGNVYSASLCEHGKVLAYSSAVDIIGSHMTGSLK